MSPAELHALDQAHYWHSFTQMAEYESAIIARGEGVWIEDVEGRRYIDAASSLWCNLHGHRHPKIDAAIRAQLDRIAHCTSLGMGADVTVQAARGLADLTGNQLPRVFFSSDGSSAIEVALKIAFQYWQQCEPAQPKRTKFLALDAAYHGDTLGAASVCGIDRYAALFKPLLFDVIRGPMPDDRRGTAADFLTPLAQLFAAHGDELAAVVVEPLVQCAAGFAMQPLGFLRGLRELATKHGTLLIADEVAVGFGRTGTMFACEQEGVLPDILCLGKGITAGYLPLAATLVKEEIYSAFLGPANSGRALFHGHSYSGNALASAAVVANLELFHQEETLSQLSAKIKHLANWLARIATKPGIKNVRQRGLIAAFDTLPGAGTQIAEYARTHGVWLRPQPNFVYVMPPLAITLEELDTLMQTITTACDLALTRQ